MKSPQAFGKYLLLERVSVGGMAEVFIAKAFGVEGFERILAIKKILPTMAEDLEFITMFIDEARISSQLNHANVVHIHELGKTDDSYYIAMEYVPGLDLRAIAELYRRERQAMPVPMAVFVASKVCEGLDYAHRKKDQRGMDLNIVHRDVSPQNVLISYEGEVKIIDFGIAKAANRSQQTQVGILKGKFGYMSPEQAMGKPIDRRSDLFAVGVMLYELLTGDRLFVGESDFSVVEKVRNADILSPRELNPEIPKALEKVLLKALARDVKDRYQWCSELQEDLLRFLVSDGQIYSSKQLSTFMKEAFADDMLREAERMERYATIVRPPGLEDSQVAPAPRKRSISRQLPAASTPSRGVPITNPPTASARGSGAVRRPTPARAVPAEPIGRRTTPPPRRAVESDEVGDAPPPADRTQIVDASLLRDDANPAAKPKVVIGDKEVHGPTVVKTAPDESSRKSNKRPRGPGIEASPSVVVDAGLGAEATGPYDRMDDGVEDLPDSTGSFSMSEDDDEPRTQGVDAYGMGLADEPRTQAGESYAFSDPVEEAPAPTRRPPPDTSRRFDDDEDDAPPPWPSMEGKGETFVGRLPDLPEERDSLRPAGAQRPGTAITGERPSPAPETDDATGTGLTGPQTVIPSDFGGELGGGDTASTGPAMDAVPERLGDSNETTPADVPAETPGDEAQPPSLAASAPAGTATGVQSPGFEPAAPDAGAASHALGDEEALPSTGSATQLAVEGLPDLALAARSTADELNDLMGGPSEAEDAARAGFDTTGQTGAPAEPPSDEEAPPADVTGQTQLPQDASEALGAPDDAAAAETPAAAEDETAAEPPPEDDASEHTGAERTAAIEAPQFAQQLAQQLGQEEGEGYQGHDRTADTVIPSELNAAGDSDSDSEDGYQDSDRTAATAPPSELLRGLDQDEEPVGYQGADRTAATPAPSELQDAPDDEAVGYQGAERTAAIPAPSSFQDDEDDQEEPVGYEGHDRTAAVPAPSELMDAPEPGFDGTGRVPTPAELQDEAGDDRYGDAEGDAEDDAATTPERTRRRPVPSAPGFFASRRNVVAVAIGGGALVLITLLVALLAGGGGSGGVLVLVSPSEGARITLDGKAVNHGEVLTGIAPGDHELVVSAPGFKESRQRVRTTEAEVTIQVALEPDAAAPAVATAPGAEAAPTGETAPAPEGAPAAEDTGAAVAEAAPADPASAEPAGAAKPEPVAEKPAPAAEPAKTETVRAAAAASSSDEEDDEQVRVARATRPKADPEIRTTRTAPAAPKSKGTGSLACTSSPQGAEIWVNGKNTGRKTPLPFGSALTLPVGTHTLMLKLGNQKHVRQIEITRGEMTIVRNAPLK